MSSLEKIDLAEKDYCTDGKPSLGAAHTMLRTRWEQGLRDSETVLRLLFLLWYSNVEPPALTGLPTNENFSAVFRQVFESVGGTESQDNEILFAVGTFCEIAPWSLGNDAEWSMIGERCRHELQKRGFNSLGQVPFTQRGAYGQYMSSYYSRK